MKIWSYYLLLSKLDTTFLLSYSGPKCICQHLMDCMDTCLGGQVDLWCLCIHPLGEGAHGARRPTHFVVYLARKKVQDNTTFTPSWGSLVREYTGFLLVAERNAGAFNVIHRTHLLYWFILCRFSSQVSHRIFENTWSKIDVLSAVVMLLLFFPCCYRRLGKVLICWFQTSAPRLCQTGQYIFLSVWLFSHTGCVV